MSQGASLQPLRDVLEELLDCSTRLHDTLLAERESLTQHNLNTLNAHTEAKKDLLLRLEALEVQRRAQLNQLGFDPGEEQPVVVHHEHSHGFTHRWTSVPSPIVEVTWAPPPLRCIRPMIDDSTP